MFKLYIILCSLNSLNCDVVIHDMTIRDEYKTLYECNIAKAITSSEVQIPGLLAHFECSRYSIEQFRKINESEKIT